MQPLILLWLVSTRLISPSSVKYCSSVLVSIMLFFTEYSIWTRSCITAGCICYQFRRGVAWMSISMQLMNFKEISNKPCGLLDFPKATSSISIPCLRIYSKHSPTVLDSLINESSSKIASKTYYRLGLRISSTKEELPLYSSREGSIQILSRSFLNFSQPSLSFQRGDS